MAITSGELARPRPPLTLEADVSREVAVIALFFQGSPSFGFRLVTPNGFVTPNDIVIPNDSGTPGPGAIRGYADRNGPPMGEQGVIEVEQHGDRAARRGVRALPNGGDHCESMSTRAISEQVTSTRR